MITAKQAKEIYRIVKKRIEEAKALLTNTNARKMQFKNYRDWLENDVKDIQANEGFPPEKDFDYDDHMFPLMKEAETLIVPLANIFHELQAEEDRNNSAALSMAAEMPGLWKEKLL